MLLQYSSFVFPHCRPPISICILNSRYDIIPRICRRLGYKLVGENEHWNVCWTDSLVGVDFCRDMRRFQKINHFPGMFEICRKDLLARNLNRMMKMFPTEYQIFPKTWVFPAEFVAKTIRRCTGIDNINNFILLLSVWVRLLPTVGHIVAKRIF